MTEEARQGATRPRRSTRWRMLSIACAATGLLGAGLAAAPAGAMMQAGDTSRTCTPSDGAPSGARAMHGADASDPNSLSPAAAARADRQLSAGLSAERISERAIANRAARGNWSPLSYKIDVHVHVIVRNNGSGKVPLWQIGKQIRVLNMAYRGVGPSADSAPTPFRFDLRSIDVTRNTDWYDWSVYTDTDDEEAKAALHKGGLDDLNVYVTGLQDGLLGYATFPFDGSDPELDGLVLLNESLPGGAAAPYNEGDTATHEVGHWLGLFHTFQDGCDVPGDYVDDTPYQLDEDNIFFCNEDDDTCPDPGLDPVHNFMSYGDDPCLDNYTRGQAARQIATWLVYRAEGF